MRGLCCTFYSRGYSTLPLTGLVWRQEARAPASTLTKKPHNEATPEGAGGRQPGGPPHEPAYGREGGEGERGPQSLTAVSRRPRGLAASDSCCSIVAASELVMHCTTPSGVEWGSCLRLSALNAPCRSINSISMSQRSLILLYVLPWNSATCLWRMRRAFAASGSTPPCDMYTIGRYRILAALHLSSAPCRVRL